MSQSNEPFDCRAETEGDHNAAGLNIPPPPEGGDWVFDEQSGMYWSDQEFLYMDPWTQHSYDPNSEMWYDPDADEWYVGEAREDDDHVPAVDE